MLTETINSNFYNLSQINDIETNGEDYKLSENIIQIINSISEKVGAPSYIKTPTFNKKAKEQRKDKKKKNMEINDDDWAAIRNFQITEKKKKEGIELLIDQIRSELNKLSDKNYDKHKNKILEIMSELSNNDFTDEDKNKVVNLIFDVASNNKFYSKIYADLYKDLIHFYSSLNSILERQISSFKSMFEKIEYCDPDKDYEKYCRNNKINESRRAMTTFIVNLQKLGVIDIEELFKIIIHLKQISYEMINKEDSKNILCEITENLFILITELKNNIKEWNKDEYDELVNYITNFKSYKVKEYPGLSNKTLFKYMDIHDNLNKI